jgi:hypothetical protein
MKLHELLPGADEDFLDAILLRTDYKVNIKP